MPVVTKFLLTVGLVVASTMMGYLARRRGWVPERAARWLMTGVVVFGYSPVSFCSIWSIQPKAADSWLPVLGGVQVVLMAMFGMLAGRWLGREKADCGLLGMAGAVGNTGFTMGGFVIYLLFGVEGDGVAELSAEGSLSEGQGVLAGTILGAASSLLCSEHRDVVATYLMVLES